jgi:FtsP/CotA-like multicopper oxidase with cupredoxin domain
MMSRRDLDRERARLNRQELINAGLTRRDLARHGLLTAAGMLIPKPGLSARALNSAGDDSGSPASPPTRPFVEELRRLDVAESCAEAVLGPTPTEDPNTAAGEGRRKRHQRFHDFDGGSKKYYDMHQREGLQRVHPDLPDQLIWGYGERLENGTLRPPRTPGPVYHAHYGEPACVRMHNDLPALDQHVGFGRSETSPHLHNGHTASESDGNPLDYFGPGTFYDQHYPHILAGFDDDRFRDPATGRRGDVCQTMSTLWYHDHRLDFTSQNVYKGLAGMYLLFSPQDSGDETDTAPEAFRLPSHDFDVPLMLGDRVFDRQGNLYFDLFNLDGIIGDKFLVNGSIQPRMSVHPRKYRFRILNGGPSRFYRLFLTDLQDPSAVNPFVQISNDGNLLPSPVDVTSITVSVAERMDIIVDFSRFGGKSVYLENRMEQTNGRGPTGKTLAAGAGNLILRFDVDRPPVADSPPLPDRFFPAPAIDLSEVVQTRTFRFDRSNGAWTINNRFFDEHRIDAKPRQNTCEIWTIQNNSGGWQHPIHMHMEECQILSRNGRTPPVTESSKKDTIRLGFNEEVVFLMRFREWLGLYPMHCHNVVHEDHAMMMQWEVQPSS